MCSSQQTTFPQHLIASPTGTYRHLQALEGHLDSDASFLSNMFFFVFFILLITPYNDSSGGNALACMEVLVVTIS